jgi:hypothetical protein
LRADEGATDLEASQQLRKPLGVAPGFVRRRAVRWRVTGTFNGSRSFQGLAPTGKQVDIAGCDMTWAKDGKIARVEAYYDTSSLSPP